MSRKITAIAMVMLLVSGLFVAHAGNEEDRGIELRGMVYYLEVGQRLPAPELPLMLIYYDGGQQIIKEMHTDSQGLFVARNLLPGDYVLSVNAPIKHPFENSIVPFRLKSSDSIDIEVTRGDYLDLTALHKGTNQPAEGVRVIIRDKLSGEEFRFARKTNSEGNLIYRDVPKGEYLIEIGGGSYPDREYVKLAPIALEYDGYKHIEVQVEEVIHEVAKISGRVLMKKEEVVSPINRVRVALFKNAPEYWGLEDFSRPNRITGATVKKDGNFTMEINPRVASYVGHDIEAGTYYIRASFFPAETHLETLITDIRPIEYQPGKDIDDVILTLEYPETAVLEGRLFYSDGRPVEDGRIRLLGEFREKIVETGWATTDAEGLYRIIIPAGQHLCFASYRVDRLIYSSDTTELTIEGGQTKNLDITLRESPMELSEDTWLLFEKTRQALQKTSEDREEY